MIEKLCFQKLQKKLYKTNVSCIPNGSDIFTLCQFRS